jgi:hypothetical protein
MRAITLLAALLFTAACAVNGTVSEVEEEKESATVPFRVVANDSYATYTETTARTAFDVDTYRAMWDELVGIGTPPAVDFPSESAVFLFAGQRNTGGYKYEVRGVQRKGELLIVDAPLIGPGRGAIVTMALTSPYVVIAVRARGFKTVIAKS